MGAPEQLLDLCPGVLFTQREDFSFDYISPGIEKWSGFSAAEWLRRRDLLERLIVDADAAAFRRHLANSLSAPGATQTSFRLRNRHTGRITYLAEKRRAVRTVAGKVASFEGVWVDVSLETLAGRRLENASWDAAFGLAAVGAAHDLNNKLTAILSLSDLYLTEMDKTHPLRDGLATIKQSAQQASHILHQLAALHQAVPGQHEFVDLNAFVTTAGELLRRVMPSRITVQTALHNEAAPVMVDRVHFQRLILSWALHAVERMPKRGTFRLETVRVPHQENSWVALKVRDTGREVTRQRDDAAFHGVSESPDVATLGHIAEFAKTYGGVLEWQSEAAGTTVDIMFPPERFQAKAANSDTPWVLIINREAETLDELPEQLEARGAKPVIGHNSAEEQLDSNWFLWDAVIVHAPAEGVAEIFEAFRRRKLQGKLIVSLCRGEVSDLTPWIATTAELIIPADLPNHLRAEKIVKSMM